MTESRRYDRGEWNDWDNSTHCGLVTTYDDTELTESSLPDGSKPLPEPILIYHYRGPVVFNSNSTTGANSTIAYNDLESYNFEIKKKPVFLTTHGDVQNHYAEHHNSAHKTCSQYMPLCNTVTWDFNVRDRSITWRLPMWRKAETRWHFGLGKLNEFDLKLAVDVASWINNNECDLFHKIGDRYQNIFTCGKRTHLVL